MTDEALIPTLDKRLPAGALMGTVVEPTSEPKPLAPVAAEPIKPEPDPEPTAKERIQAIAAALPHASPSGVETLAGELAGLAEGL